MADLNFPLNPQVNDLYTLNDRTFRYDGAKWRYISLSLVTVTSGTAVTSINSLTNSAQVFSVGSSGSGFNISSSGLTHTFNIPIAGSGSTGLITTQTQTIAGAKTFSSDLLVSSSTASTNTTTGALSLSGGAAIGGSLNVAGRINLWNSTNYTSFVSSASGNTVYTLPATSPATGTSVLQSDTTGVLSWVPMTATGGIAVSGAVDGSIQFKSGSGLGATRSFTINPNHFGIRLGNFPGSTTTTNSAALLIEQSIGSFIGSTSGTLIGVSASTGFTGDWINIQVNSVSKYKMDNTGAIIHDVGTTSTSNSTGALVVTGGVGIGGSLHVASATAISGVTINAGVITGSLTGTATTATYSNQSGYATTSGIASTSQSINTVSANTLATHYLLFSPVDGGSGVAVSSDTNLTYNPSTNVITTNTFSGNLSATAVTSTNFYGTLTGNVTGTATSAQNVNVVAANTNSNHPVLFTPTSGSASGVAVSSESSFVYNPSTDILSVSGLAVTSSTASTSSSTGSLIVTGGAGIGRTLNIGGRATIGSTDFGATLSLSAQNTGLKSLVIRKLASQSANTFEIQDADGNALISTSFNAGSGQTGSGVLNIHANRDVGDASSETVFAVKNGSNNVFRIGRNGDLGFFSTLQGGDGAGSYETIFQNIYGSRVNWQKLVWFSGSGFNFINAGANFVNNSSQLAISNAGTTSVTGVMVIANGWDTGGGTRVFGIGTPGSGERSYFKGYGNLVINPNNPNSLHAAWNTMDLITMDISGTATTFAGNIILGKVEGTERFSVGPFGNTKISVGTATTATGLIVKAVASQTGNLLETQSSSGTTNFYITPSGSVSIGATTISTSTTTGALLVTGGVGIGGSLYVTSATAISGITINSGVITGSLTGTATTATYSLQSGYGITAGIATTSNNVNVVAATSNSFHRVLFTPASGTASGAAVSTESSFVYNPSTDILSISGLAVTSTTNSTNTTTGSLTITGGVGIGQSVSVGGRLQLFNSSNYTAFVSSASGNTVYSLPATTPSTGSSVLQSTSAGVMSWVPMTASGGLAISGSTDGTVQFKSGSSLGATNSLFFDTSLLGLRVSGFPGGSTPSSTDAALKVEQTVSSFNGSTSGTMIAVNANTGFAGDLINLQVNAVSKFRIDNTGAIIQNIGTNSSSTTSGAVQVRGGVGITGAVYVGESVNATSLTQSTSTTSGSLVVSGGAGIAQSVSIGGRLQLFNSSNYTAFVSSASGNTVYTLPATSPATGSSVLQSTSAGVMSWVAMTAGSSSGNTSQNIAVNVAGNPNTFHPVLFTPSSLSAGSAISSDSTISFNPSTEILNVSGLAITSGTASTNTTTGALVVKGGLGVTGQLSFVSASFGYTGITSNPSMSFIGATSSSPITLTVLTDNSLSWEGSQGSVFSIDSNLSSGEIFSVSDISGLPIISASAGQTVTFNEFGGFTKIGNGTLNSSSTSTGSLVIAGGLGMTGNANIGGTTTISNTTPSVSSSSGALVVSGGVGIGGTLFILGNIRTGTNTFSKAGMGAGDILFDNGSADTPASLYYWANNRNFGTDVYFSGSGTTRYRIVKELNESGGAELWSIDREGIVYRSAYAVGEVIASRMYNYSDLGMSATTTISSTSYTTFATITYTPKSSSSYLWIEFSCTYSVAGAAGDDFWSNIEVAGSEIVNANQVWTNGAGGGTRSGVMFPLAARYTNSGTAGIAVSVRSKRGTSDDNATIYGNNASGFMRIQEIGR